MKPSLIFNPAFCHDRKPFKYINIFFKVKSQHALNWQPHIMDMNADTPARKRDTPRIVLPRNLWMISLSGKDADCVMSPGNRSLLQLG